MAKFEENQIMSEQMAPCSDSTQGVTTLQKVIDDQTKPELHDTRFKNVTLQNATPYEPNVTFYLS
jgi:hypothetical protein